MKYLNNTRKRRKVKILVTRPSSRTIEDGPVNCCRRGLILETEVHGDWIPVGVYNYGLLESFHLESWTG